MIHSARPMVTPVANIVFSCFVFLDLKSGDGQITCAKTIIPTGRSFGLAQCINSLYFDFNIGILNSMSYLLNPLENLQVGMIMCLTQ